jgi:hypothetical protein
MLNMLLNKTKFLDNIISFINNKDEAIFNGLYIVGTTPSLELIGHQNDYVKVYIDPITFDKTLTFTQSFTDDIVYVESEGTKFIFNGDDWVIPVYSIPLTVELDVFREANYVGTDLELMSTIKQAIMDAISSKFGINANIYTSEIINAVHGVTGVHHCSLISPKSDIFFDFDINEFVKKPGEEICEDLMRYGPEYVYFTEDDIRINVL